MESSMSPVFCEGAAYVSVVEVGGIGVSLVPGTTGVVAAEPGIGLVGWRARRFFGGIVGF